MHDIIVFGATSFVGQILVRYLAERYPHGELRWAIAGRSAEKLAALRESLGAAYAQLPLIVADAHDDAALRTMCQTTRLIVSTVGPYARYGEPLVRACAEMGTDYCDLTGELLWIRRMIERYEARAHATGARILHCCGFDSIPSDLGVYLLQREAVRHSGAPCTEVKLRVRQLRGGISGGTAASMLNMVREVAADPALRRELADPYILCPAPAAGQRQPSLTEIGYDSELDSWCAPFVMAGINTRIVHRSNALQQFAYGRDFRYGEGMLMGRGLGGQLRATAVSLGMATLMLAGAVGPTRTLLERYLLPAPGTGPSEVAQQRGSFALQLYGRTNNGALIGVTVTGDRDPGYGSTARMLGEAAACLVYDCPAEVAGGFWTTASLLGDKLIARLEHWAGLRFTVELLDVDV